MNTLSFFIAWRYLRTTAYQKSSSTMVKICFLSIAIGTGSLALVTAVMNGFQYAIHKKMQGIHAQIIIQSPDGSPLAADRIQKVITAEFPDVIGSSPSTMQHALITNSDHDNEPMVVMLKAIDPRQELRTTSLAQTIIHPKNKPFEKLFAPNSVILGKTLAQNMAITIGDTVTLLHADQMTSGQRKVSFSQTEARVTGIFDTGIDEYDASSALCSFDFLNELYPDRGVSQINLATAPNTNESALIKKLSERLGLEVFSWQALYPALVSALTLEKYAMFIILALITLVASMNIISLLFMHITQKRSDIALLHILGCPEKTIARIFVLMGMIIATAGTITGLVGAYCASWLLEKYLIIPLPDSYYVSQVPAHMTIEIMLSVFIVVLMLSFMATWIPTRRIKTINVAQVLRFEG